MPTPDRPNLREKAAYCRQLATTVPDPDLAKAILDLAEEFDQAAFDSLGPPTPVKSRKRR